MPGYELVRNKEGTSKMITCEEASRLISESLDRELPLGTRIALRIHLLMCKLCPRFLRQMLFLKEASDPYQKEIEGDPSYSLSINARERIKSLLAPNPEKKDHTHD